jgi:glutamate-1-semialdehyde 2,1-aminomutase
MANGYPIAALGGKSSLMEYTVHPDLEKRVLVAGTYNAHPAPTVAAIATIERLMMNSGAVYRHVEELGMRLENGVLSMLKHLEITGTVVRQGSAFCLYFMDHAPVDWHDLASSHLFFLDTAMRQHLIAKGIYFFPVATKQGSISAAHTTDDIDHTILQWEEVLESMILDTAHGDLFVNRA